MPFALDNFRAIQTEHSAHLLRDHQLVIKTGTHLNSSVLKLTKDRWTNDTHESIRNETGIFFALWVELAGKNCDTVMYNIHAFKLRKLRDHKILARDFAERFRIAVRQKVKDWPSISFDYGPLTLLQGHFPQSESTFEKDCLDRIKAFACLCPIIDGLLESRL